MFLKTDSPGRRVRDSVSSHPDSPLGEGAPHPALAGAPSPSRARAELREPVLLFALKLEVIGSVIAVLVDTTPLPPLSPATTSHQPRHFLECRDRWRMRGRCMELPCGPVKFACVRCSSSTTSRARAKQNAFARDLFPQLQHNNHIGADAPELLRLNAFRQLHRLPPPRLLERRPRTTEPPSVRRHWSALRLFFLSPFLPPFWRP
ncbi:unnamed protein product [Trichogramma brassicae]|uniref:Uncharacterized protein n=1 Tax=Trichogramma brassicae TaxID=86971 RepID=A0A6H5I1H4_9HYME|nr:unnamed protein product [Trichogramma brassicae]